MNIKRPLLVVFLVFSFVLVNADTIHQFPNKERDTLKFINKKQIVGAGVLLNTCGILYSGYKWWWQDIGNGLTFKYEGGFNNYSYGLDKCGHFYISYLYTNAIYNAMQWSGYNNKTTLIAAAGVPFLWALFIELGDGFTNYKFSPDDLLANSLGISYALAQKRKPYLNHFKIKF